jgi:hypothetical protein
MTSRGFLQATDNPDQVEWWWQQEPEANIGIRTGVAFDVLDLDGPTALETLARIAPGYKHQGPVSFTGKGYHLLFAPTGKGCFSNPVGRETAFPGIDYRGHGGYVVAPPSIHPNGDQYRWHRPPGTDLPQAPQWVIDLHPVPRERTTPLPSAAMTAGMDLVAELQSMGCELKPYGSSRLRGYCPFHDDSTPSFVVYLHNDTFFCFGCRAWGDALNVARYKRTGALR